MRKYYAQVLLWSKHRHADKVLALLSLIEASVLPLPPDVLMTSMSLARPKKAFYYALITTVFSVLGGLIGYAIGYHLWPLIQDFAFQHLFSPEHFEKVRVLYEDNLFGSVFVAGYTPLPYKMFTLAAGVFHVNFRIFLLACIAGRGLRFFLIALIIYKKGSRARKWVSKNLNKILMTSSVIIMTVFILCKIYF